jgi:hypothetical protein
MTRSRVHLVFHISKVKLFKGVSKKAELFGDDGAVEPDQWEVSEISVWGETAAKRMPHVGFQTVSGGRGPNILYSLPERSYENTA